MCEWSKVLDCCFVCVMCWRIARLDRADLAYTYDSEDGGPWHPFCFTLWCKKTTVITTVTSWAVIVNNDISVIYIVVAEHQSESDSNVKDRKERWDGLIAPVGKVDPNQHHDKLNTWVIMMILAGYIVNALAGVIAVYSSWRLVWTPFLVMCEVLYRGRCKPATHPKVLGLTLHARDIP